MTAPALSQAILDRWSIEAHVLIADTRSSLVYRVTRRDRSSAIVKSLKPDGLEEMGGFDFLEWREGLGAIRLIDRAAQTALLEDAGSITLRQYRIDAGEQASVGIIAGIVENLHSASSKPRPSSLVPLIRHFSALFERAERETTSELADFLRASAGEASRLLSHQEGVRPLHGDLHHDNIVSESGRDWRAIDPHGLLGDPAYDVANVFGNPLGARSDILDPHRILFLARHFADVIGCSAEKILRYALAHAALSMCWSLERPDVAKEMENAEERHAFAILARQLLDDGVLRTA